MAKKKTPASEKKAVHSSNGNAGSGVKSGTTGNSAAAASPVIAKPRIRDLNAEFAFQEAEKKETPQHSEWFEDEAFWLNYGPIMFDTQRWAEAAAVAADVCKIAGLAKGNSILDAGCGPGRIAVELASRGLNVTGVDIIQPFLDAAAESAVDEGVGDRLTLVRRDLREYKSPRLFDAACNLYTSFGYCATIAEDQLILKNIAASLKDGGYFILESNSREIAVRDYTDGEWFERAGMTVLTEFHVEGAWEGLRSKWILIAPDGQRIVHEFVQRLYSAIELKRLMLASGFKTAEIYGDFDFSPYDHKARTMVIVARK